MAQGVRQIEFELTEATGRRANGVVAGTRPRAPLRSGPSSLERWCSAATEAPEACVVIDTEQRLLASSQSWCALVGIPDPAAAYGHPLLSVVRLLDFGDGADLDEGEATKIPPLLAIKSKTLARGLVRVPGTGEEPTTLDCVATPLWDGETLVGSLSFFAKL